MLMINHIVCLCITGQLSFGLVGGSPRVLRFHSYLLLAIQDLAINGRNVIKTKTPLNSLPV